MKPAYPTLLFALLLCTCVRAQTYVEVTLQQNLSTFDIGGGNPLVPVRDSVTNYKITYNTIDAAGEPTVASGMLALPTPDSISYPIAAYMHGTVADREAVPSRVTTAERGIVNILASNGYITVAPDYIGLGDNEGFHPYVHAASESSAGRDLILAARQWLSEQEIAFSEQLFVTGYSQGGHAAQALHRDLQADTASLGLTVTAATHLSGPYSISGVMREAALSEELVTLPGYIVYTYASYNNVYGIYDNLEEVFVPPYLSVITAYDREEIDGFTFNDTLTKLLTANEDRLIDMFQDSIGQQISTDDDDSRLIQALRLNDTYRWAPEAPTLLYTCALDEQVPPLNAQVALDTMTLLGSTTVSSQSGGNRDHRECVTVALLTTLQFFNTYAVREPATAVGRPLVLPQLGVYPNPALRNGRLSVSGLDPAREYTYRIVDLAGRLLQSGGYASGRAIDLGPGLAAGVYLLRIVQDNGDFAVRRLVLR